VIATPLCGYYLPKLGIKFTLVSGMLLVGGAFFLMGFLVDMPSGVVFLVFGILLRMTEGVGWAMCTTTTLSLVAQLFPDYVGTLSGLIEVGTGLGFTAGPPIGSLLFAVGGFKIPFWSVGGVILILVPLLFLLVKPTSCSSEVLSLVTIVKLLSHLSFSMLVIGNVIVFISLSYFNPTFAPFLSNQFGMDQLHISLMFIIVAGMYLLLALVVGRLSDKFSTLDHYCWTGRCGPWNTSGHCTDILRSFKTST
jgi:MFS family permease